MENTRRNYPKRKNQTYTSRDRRRGQTEQTSQKDFLGVQICVSAILVIITVFLITVHTDFTSSVRQRLKGAISNSITKEAFLSMIEKSKENLDQAQDGAIEVFHNLGIRKKEDKKTEDSLEKQKGDEITPSQDETLKEDAALKQNDLENTTKQTESETKNLIPPEEILPEN